MIKKVFLIHHSHTDIGFTDFAGKIVKKQVGDLRRAVEYCRRDPDFHWTCESAWVPHYLLRDGSGREAGELLARLREGRIEISGCYTQYLTECLRPEELARSFDFVRELRDRHGIPCRSALISDIGGYSWSLPKFFSEAGVEFLCAGVGGYKTLFILNQLPNLFRWQGRDRSELLFWQLGLGGKLPEAGLLAQYGMGIYALTVPLYRHFGHGFAAREENPEWHGICEELLHAEHGKIWNNIENWFVAQGRTSPDRSRPDGLMRLLSGRLEADGYPFDAMLLQYAADNYGPDFSLPEAVRQWNAAGLFPEIELATPARFFDYIAERYDREAIAARAGELACSWSDHEIHMPLRTAQVRTEGELLGQLERVAAAAGKYELLPEIRENYRQTALYHEHTFGLNCDRESARIIDGFMRNEPPSLDDPMFERLTRSWQDKEEVALRIASGNRLLLNGLSPKNAGTHESAVNTLLWNREALIWRENGSPFDPDATLDLMGGGDLPPLREIRLHPEKFERFHPAPCGDRIVETDFYRLALQDGTVKSLFDKLNRRELVDAEAAFGFNQYVLAELIDLNPAIVDGGIREQVKMNFITPRVKKICHACGREAEVLRIHSELISGGDPMPLVQTIILYRRHPRSEWITDIRKPAVLHKEEHYLAFPFSMENFTARCGLADGWFEIGAEELSGSHADYYTTQSWVDLNAGDRGIIWASRESMVFEIGAIRTHRWENPRLPETAHLFAYLMSNNSLTNLPLYQSGDMRFSFAITPYPGSFDFARSLRNGMEWNNPPLLHTGGLSLPEHGLEIRSSHPAVVVRHIFPAEGGRTGIRLVETSGRRIQAELHIDKSGDWRQLPFVINPWQTLTVRAPRR